MFSFFTGRNAISVPRREPDTAFHRLEVSDAIGIPAPLTPRNQSSQLVLLPVAILASARGLVFSALGVGSGSLATSPQPLEHHRRPSPVHFRDATQHLPASARAPKPIVNAREMERPKKSPRTFVFSVPKRDRMRLAHHYQSLLDSVKVETRAELAHNLGVSRARVTLVLNRLTAEQSFENEGDD